MYENVRIRRIEYVFNYVVMHDHMSLTDGVEKMFYHQSIVLSYLFYFVPSADKYINLLVGRSNTKYDHSKIIYY